MLAHRHPQQLHPAIQQVPLHQSAVKPCEERVAERPRLPLRHPMRLVERGEPVQPVQALRHGGRSLQRDRAELPVFLHAAADLRAGVGADALQEITPGVPHRLQVHGIRLPDPVLAGHLAPASRLDTRRPARARQPRHANLGHAAQRSQPVAQHGGAHRLGLRPVEQEVVVLDGEDVAVRTACGVQVGRCTEAKAEALAWRSVDDQRQPDRLLALTGLQQARLDVGRQGVEPHPDPRPRGEEAGVRAGLQRLPLRLQA